MSTIALFLARAPGPPMTGRKQVINAAIAALGTGHEIDLFVLGTRQGRCGGAERRLHVERRKSGRLAERRLGDRRARGRARRALWLGTPGKLAILRNAGLCLLKRDDSLNEALFRSARLLSRVRRLGTRYDFAMADTLRAAPYASALGVPWHLDLDDLFSARYEHYVAQASQLSPKLVLGYYRDSVPWVVSMLPKSALARLLASEAARLRRRELYWAKRASTVSLVSPHEAQCFAGALGRQVYNLPMSVAVPPAPWTFAGAAAGAPAFVGGLDYKPNLDALGHYQEFLFAQVRALGLPARVEHIGNAPSQLRAKLRPDVVSFAGYVPDVFARLRKAAFFVAPIVSGTGIKSKVLEAMAVGLPVLATRQAVSGLDVQHGRHCFIFTRAEEYIDGLRYVANPQLAEAMGREARGYVKRNFAPEVLRERWVRVVADLGRRAEGRLDGRLGGS